MKPCNEPCQKCGGTDIYRKFIPKGGQYDEMNSDLLFDTDISADEFIRHHCRTYEFEWAGNVMAKEQTK